MATIRHTARVSTQTPTMSKSFKNGKPQRGRPLKPEQKQLKYRIQIALTETQHEAFTRWMATHTLFTEAGAGTKIVIERLRQEGFLIDASNAEI